MNDALFSFPSKSSFIHDILISTAKEYPNFCSRFFFRREEVSSILENMGKYEIAVGNILWKFPVGLSSGLDKDASLINFLSQFYLGSLEIGPLSLNPKRILKKEGSFFGISKWMERLEDKQSLRTMNNFSELPPEKIRENILHSKRFIPLGLALGDIVPSLQGQMDTVVNTYHYFSSFCDYFVIDPMDFSLLKEVLEELKLTKPTYLKISPDLTHKEIIDQLHLVVDYKLQGVIATGPTKEHPFGQGEIGGAYLRDRAQSIQHFILEILKNEKGPQVIGSGGISRFIDIWNFWKQGGKVVQLFSSFIYQGPNLLFKIKKEIDDILKYYHLNSVQQILENIDDLHYPLPRKRSLQK